MKCYKLFKAASFISIVIFLLVYTCLGQNIIETPKTFNTKRSPGKECNLTEHERQYIFTKVEILATFKGYSEEWFKYAQKNFDFNQVSQNLSDTTQSFHDSIFLKFIVTKTGLICKIEVLKGNKVLTAPAIKLLQMSSPWIPAVSGGRNLNAYRTLKIEVLIDKKEREFKIIKDFISYSNPYG